MIVCEFCNRRFEPVWVLDYCDGLHYDYTCNCPVCGEEYIREEFDWTAE